ncbi:MAG: rhodanese-like domain-containing protein [Candidatus Aminicenantes bacterium]|nr:MAG: rhodanese-like domain-containing protein [Candidatus Aminicenantes bacterium]
MRKIFLLVMGWVFLSGMLFCQDVKEIAPSEAFDLAKKIDAYLIDIRTIAEYVYVGHPENAYCLPLLFWDEKGQTQVRNRNFLHDLVSRFKKQDSLVFICRSGNRSQAAGRMAANAGFRKVFNVKEGFEGKKDEKGYRTIGGWKNRGLPYTYILNEKYVYK